MSFSVDIQALPLENLPEYQEWPAALLVCFRHICMYPLSKLLTHCLVIAFEMQLPFVNCTLHKVMGGRGEQVGPGYLLM